MITLTLRHLWTSTGGPLTWEVTEEDEQVLRDLLKELDEWKADADLNSAVLLAVEADGTPIGAWNREGATRLQIALDAEPRSEDLLQVRHALRDGVTGA